MTQYLPSARPGSRAPHVWLERGGERLSTIDLFGRGFVLLTGPEGVAWAVAMASMRTPGRPALAAHVVGGAEFGNAEGSWRAAYGLEPDGAILIRPDGYVGWRSRVGADDPGRVLADALDRILSCC